MFWLRIVLAISLVGLAVILLYFGSLGQQFKILSRSQEFLLLYLGGMLALFLASILSVALLVATWTPRREAVVRWLESGFTLVTRLGKLNLFLFGAGIVVYSFLVTGPFAKFLGQPEFRWPGLWFLLLGGAILLKASGFGWDWGRAAVASALISAVGYKLAAFSLDVSTYPFSLGWSEASRYYYASLYFSDKLYSIHIPPTVLHPSRYLMQAVPFLIPNSPLWLHRLWQVFLWIATTMATALLLAKRLSIPDRFQRWAFILWTCLFVLLGPVYYHLQAPVILVLWLFDRRRPWRTLGVVLLASLWAGISRVNWLPVPGMLAAMLYFLEQPLEETGKSTSSMARYLVKPLLWTLLGTLVAFLAQASYALLSGNPTGQFSSSFTSDLLWYRLLPSATYPLGILPAAFLVCGPPLWLALSRVKDCWRSFHLLRWLGIGAILFPLFAGGIVVSVKIGGGSNLHNLDGFLTLLLVFCSHLYFDRFVPEDRPALIPSAPARLTSLSWAALVMTLLIPVIFTFSADPSRRLPGKKLVDEALATIQAAVDQAARNDGQVLFISERQLLMFDSIHGATMAPEYEKVFLMEMAMANNPDYLEQLEKNLKDHRYAIIVSEPLKDIQQSRANSFGEENNAWVERVVRPILCYYEPVETLKEVRTQLLVPRPAGIQSGTANCP